ncbi:hypothetical protein IT570_00945 [Candidatus Sumerlaeota bacterium]|nr:hypothetical protein [Candidatus Sumerlaeota bacterium]
MFGGYIILGISLFVIVSYVVLRRNTRQRQQEEEDDEPWAQSLTEDDVQDIYGDKEERWRDD